MSNKAKAKVLDVIKFIAPEIYQYGLVLSNDIENRQNPKVGDKFQYGEKTIIFEKVMFDAEFKQGVAFDYIFHDENDESEKIKIHSINSITDENYILNINDMKDMYGFWKFTYPITE